MTQQFKEPLDNIVVGLNTVGKFMCDFAVGSLRLMEHQLPTFR